MTDICFYSYDFSLKKSYEVGTFYFRDDRNHLVPLGTVIEKVGVPHNSGMLMDVELQKNFKSSNHGYNLYKAQLLQIGEVALKFDRFLTVGTKLFFDVETSRITYLNHVKYPRQEIGVVTSHDGDDNHIVKFDLYWLKYRYKGGIC